MFSVFFLRIAVLASLHGCGYLRASALSITSRTVIERPALLCIDVQSPYIITTYKKARKGSEEAVQAFRAAGWPIYWKYWYLGGCGTAEGRWLGSYVFNEECKSFQNLSAQFMAGQDRVVHPVGEAETRRSFLTSGYSPFHPDLIRDLEQEKITKLYIIGGWWEHCITSAALHARSLGYKVAIVDSAVGGSTDLEQSTMNFLDGLGFRFEGVPQLPLYTHPSDMTTSTQIFSTPSKFVPMSQPFNAERKHSDVSLNSNSGDLRAWVDGEFSSHWDLDSIYIHDGFVNSTRLPYKRKVSNMMLVIFDACHSINNSEHSSSGVLDLFIQNGAPVYVADMETCSSLTTLKESGHVDVIHEPTPGDILRGLYARFANDVDQKGGTIVVAGDLADDPLAALSYWAFDHGYDVFLVHDATYWRGVDNAYSESKKANAINVICHAVVELGLTSDLLRLEGTPLPPSTGYFDAWISQDSLAHAVRAEEPTQAGPMAEETCVAMCSQASVEACGGVAWDPDMQRCLLYPTFPVHRLIYLDFSHGVSNLTKPLKLSIKTIGKPDRHFGHDLCRG
jgi:nicotinamidase-related amidase